MEILKNIRNRIFKILHPGKEYYCLYCHRTYGKFLHKGVKSEVFKKYNIVGSGYKENARCPNCLSIDRARLLALFFQLRTDVFTKRTEMLHVSPDKHLAGFLREFSNIKQVVGALEPAHFREFHPIKADIQKMDMDDNMFDIIICCHVIEHVDNDINAIREIYRVLRPGGFAILQVPFATDLEKSLEEKSIRNPGQRKAEYGQVDHVRLYGMDYFDRLNMAGFRVIRDNPFLNNWLTEDEIERHCLDRAEDVIIAYKD